MSRVTELAEKYGITSNRNSKLREDLREGLREEISLRDHFAGLVMQGLLSSDINTKWDEDDIALIAYGQADAMLAEREKGNDN